MKVSLKNVRETKVSIVKRRYTKWENTAEGVKVISQEGVDVVKE
jgi:hypothetical protein